MSSQDEHYLISLSDIEKVDALISALDLAVTEILQGRPVQDRRSEFKHAQLEFDDLTSEVIYRGNLSDHF